MKRYFIEIISKAADTNTSFSGIVMRYVYGKKEEMIARQAIEDPKDYGKYERQYDNTDTIWALKEYGFTSRGRAERVMRQVHSTPDSYGYWEDEVRRVIEVEI